MDTLEMLANLLSAAVGLGLVFCVVLGEPLKGSSRGRSLISGASALVTSLTLFVNRVVVNPPGIWWWLGVGGMALAAVASLVWVVAVVKYWPKAARVQAPRLRWRPAAVVLVLVGDALLLAAFRMATPPARIALFLAGCLVILAFTRLIWIEERAS